MTPTRRADGASSFNSSSCARTGVKSEVPVTLVPGPLDAVHQLRGYRVGDRGNQNRDIANDLRRRLGRGRGDGQHQIHPVRGKLLRDGQRGPGVPLGAVNVVHHVSAFSVAQLGQAIDKSLPGRVQRRVLHDLRDPHSQRSGERGNSQNKHGNKAIIKLLRKMVFDIVAHSFNSCTYHDLAGRGTARPRPCHRAAGAARLGSTHAPFHSCRFLTVFITSDVSLPTTPGVARRRRVRKSYSSSLEPTTTSRIKSYVPAHAAA